jgi:2OG-Fe(II) oxygenase superfamily
MKLPSLASSIVIVSTWPSASTFQMIPTSARVSTTKIFQGSSSLGPPLPIDESFGGLKKVHHDPDVYIIENFLDEAACTDMIECAQEKKLELSPVAYAGWTTDVKELLSLAAKGPVAWLAILTAWLQTKDDSAATVVDFVTRTALNYPIFYVVAYGGITAFIKSRTDELRSMRTSTSTTLDNLENPDSGARKFVTRAAKLFDYERRDSAQQVQSEASYFEAPTIIRYEPGQVLKPHFDANRDADTEDANRGGQTIATLLVYLNDVENGGKTRFGRLPSPDPSPEEPHLAVQPKRGDALLFFPADKDGRFDERTEHEGCPAIDEKWIARIWRHSNRVQPPFGLSSAALAKLEAQ